MNELNWDEEFERATWQHGCSDKLMQGKPSRRQRKNRRDVNRAFAAVKEACASDPLESDPAVFKKTVYSFLMPGLGWFLGKILITLVIRLVVDRLVDQLFSGKNEGEPVYGDVPVPAE